MALFPIGSDPTWISKTFKFVWILAWLAAGSYMIKQMTETVSSYLRKEVITTSSTRRGEPVEFPALTICTKRQFSEAKVLKWMETCINSTKGGLLKICKEVHDENLRQSSEVNTSQICDFDQSDCYNYDDDPEYYYDLEDASDYSNDRLHHPALWHQFPKTASNMSFTLEEIIFDPQAFGDDRPGYFKINGISYNKTQMMKYWSEAKFSLSKYGNCFSFNGFDSHRENLPILQTKPQAEFVVSLQKTAELDCFVVMIHHPSSIPLHGLGYEAKGEICENAKITFKNEVWNRLTYPHGDCISAWNEDDTLKPLLQKHPDYLGFNYRLVRLLQIVTDKARI